MANFISSASKIIRKLHVGDFAFKVSNYLNKGVNNVEKKDFHTNEFLNSISPDPKNSCICQNKIEIEADLQIIIPVYNVEEYIVECMDSVISQKTKYSFIITVINDGSPDNSRKILSNYEHFPNIEIIDQENRGFSGARNRGLEVIKGKYLMFVDSDDILKEGAVENLMNTALRLNADIVEGGHRRFIPISKNIKLVKSRKKKDNDNEQHIWGYPCGKVLISTLFENIHFPKGYWFEDTVVSSILLHLCKHTASISSLIFDYRINPSGISRTSNGKVKSLDSFYITRQLLSDRQSLGIKTTQQMYEAFLGQVRMNGKRIYSLNRTDVNVAVFIETQKLKDEYFADFKTQELRNKQLEEALDNNNYYTYITSCLLQ